MRDKIVELTESYGGTVKYKTLSGKELNKALLEKLVEEVREMQAAELEAGELADLQEILGQLAKNLKVTDAQLAEKQAKKCASNGGFAKGHFVDTVTLPADNKWAKYYGNDPKRFPEIKK